MVYIVKDVGKPPRELDSNKVVGVYGTQMSIAILEQAFVTSVTIIDDTGKITHTITKKE